MGKVIPFPTKRMPHPSLLTVGDSSKYELKQALAQIDRLHENFETIAALCTLVRAGEMKAEEAVHRIQNIVG